jgi:hypothetical protein
MKQISTALPFAVAILGGIFFGQFSCGGYVWHKTLFKIIVCVTIAICLIFRFRSLVRGSNKWQLAGLIILWLILIVASYFITEATAASFYPDSPESLQDFWQRFLNSLQYGPC